MLCGYIFLSEALNRPRLLSNSTDGDLVSIEWEVPSLDEELTEISHFSVQLGDSQLTLVRNFTTTLLLGQQRPSQSDFSQTLLRLRAVDGCGQHGEELVANISTAMRDTTLTTSRATTSQIRQMSQAPTNSARSTVKASMYTTMILQLITLSCSFSDLLLLTNLAILVTGRF